MPRPPFCRRVHAQPMHDCFKPAGIPTRELDEVVLTIDELESVRLADMEGLYQEQVAEAMGVSRQTVGRMLLSARKKIAEALVLGKALRIAGGAAVTGGLRRFLCQACAHVWEAEFGGGRPGGCPACGSPEFRRTDMVRRGKGCAKGGGMGRGHGRGRGCGCGVENQNAAEEPNSEVTGEGDASGNARADQETS